MFEKIIRTHFKDPYNIDELDQKIIRVMFEYPELSHEKTAEACQIGVAKLRSRLAKPAVQKALADIFATTISLMEKNANQAARRLAHLIDHDDPKVALAAIKIVMTPFTNSAKVDVRQIQEVIYRARFGEEGQIISDKKELYDDTTPKTTIDLLLEGSEDYGPPDDGSDDELMEGGQIRVEEDQVSQEPDAN